MKEKMFLIHSVQNFQRGRIIFKDLGRLNVLNRSLMIKTGNYLKYNIQT